MSKQQKYLLYVVDDDPCYLKGIEKSVVSEKVEVKTFSTAETFLGRLYKKPDMVILDYCLNPSDPKSLNGLELLKSIKTRSPQTFVIMLSSQDKMEVAVDTLRSGAFDYIVKNASAFSRARRRVNSLIERLTVERADHLYRQKMQAIYLVTLLIFAVSVLLQWKFPQLFR